MDASRPVDDWRPAWASFAEFFGDPRVRDDDVPYLTALDHDHPDSDHRPSRVAWTTGQWRARVATTAAALAARGVRPGDTVAALTGNTADALAVAYACWTSGACYLPLNPQEPVERHAFILRDAAATLLVSGPSGEQRSAELAARTGVATVRAAELSVEHGASGATGPAESGTGAGDLASPALRVYTSGTTGEPKAVELTAGNLLTDCDALQRRLAWDGDTRVLVVLPIHHVNGLVISSLLSFYAGASAVLCDRFRSATFWADATAEGATVCSLVPSLLEFLLADRGQPPAQFTEVLCGAGPLMCDTVAEFEDTFAVPVRHLYGLSETTAVATMMPTLEDAARRAWYTDHGFPAIGPALPHTEVQVHAPDGRPCAEEERGEIVVRGGTVMTGYAGRPDATATALRDGWFHSGDEGFWRADADGTPYFFITGRIKELIVRGGENISPFTVDEVLRGHPAVRFGLAVPFENRFYGEEIAAYVVPDGEVTAAEILDFCAARLDFASQPKVVLFGDDVPFTATGKARRLGLRDQLGDQLAEYRDVQFRRRSAVTTTGGGTHA